MAFGTMDIDKVGQINNNLNNMIQQLFREQQHSSRQGDDRILFGTMNKQKRGKIGMGINNTIREWKLVPIIRQREEKKSSTFAASLEKW
jgi:hypothetical protein